ncbi:small ribosomal subunit protein mS33-like [Clavelina lepadiformis]
MSRNPSQYARNMARLSARIFREQLPTEQHKAKLILRILGREPYYKKREFTHYYPPIQDVRDLFKTLRHLGLYVDEHMDFKEEMQRQRELRGKGKKKQ